MMSTELQIPFKRQKDEVVQARCSHEAHSLVFIQFVVEKHLSPVHDVIGRVITTLGSALTSGEISALSEYAVTGTVF